MKSVQPIYPLLADAVVVVHLGFILFVVLGGLWVARWPRLIWLHVPAVVWGVVVEFAGWTCPLTPLENWLRYRGGGAGYHSDFVAHYILPLLYPAALTRELQLVLGLLVIAINVAIYGRILAWRK